MKITGIEKKNGTRYTVYVDGEYFYIFDIEIISNNNLKVGSEVDIAILEDLKYQAEKRKARERAFHLLSYRDHSKKELYDKLIKNTTEEIATETVLKMEELGYINDENYAQKVAEFYLKQKNFSYRRSLFELKKKGINEELATMCLDNCEVCPHDQIKKIIDQKYYRYLGDFKGNQKVINALARLGFSYSDIKEVINEYDVEEDEWQYE